MRVSLYLADYAQTAPNLKVNAIGIGASSFSTPLPRHTVVLLLDLEPDEIGPVQADLVLLNESDETVQDPKGNEVRIVFEFKPEVKSGVKPSAVTLPATLDIGPGISLTPGLYRWSATVSRGELVEQVARVFQVRATNDHARAPVTT